MVLNQIDSLTTSQPDSLQFQTGNLDALYQPPPVPFTFETLGWQVLGIVMLLLLVVAAIFWLRLYVRNRYRREALKTLTKYQEGPWKVEQVYLVLKQSAMHAYGRSVAGKLYGRDWLKFLEDSGKNVHMMKFEAELNAAVYNNQSLPPETAVEFLQNAKNWIITHAGKS